MSKRATWVLCAAASLLWVAPQSARAGVIYKASFSGYSAYFNSSVDELVTCASGESAYRSTSVTVSISQETTHGAAAPVASTTMAAFWQWDGCRGEGSSGFGFADNAGKLQVNGLQSASYTGTIPLDSGTITVALTWTGINKETSQSVQVLRSNIGPYDYLQHVVGSQRTATLAGTVSVNGATVPLERASYIDAALHRANLGRITVERGPVAEGSN